ncbi:hypothetical protein KUTeg_000455 [Tegillarca granosa]|uniref:Apple domain-containing protein n=1 Tax=Tegillarca granosa TaxID=220873 RepID=A0ABQ9FXK9_TEGGR|nr:hypothetical protein KUTeg_000455 [Tegillarca granosa]
MEKQHNKILSRSVFLVTADAHKEKIGTKGKFGNQHNKILDSDSYKQFDNIGIKQCAKRCYAEADCQSINFFKTTFTCFLNYHNSQYKQLVSNAEFAYGDRSHMSQYFSATKDCLNGQVSLEMHDFSSYCYDGD